MLYTIERTPIEELEASIERAKDTVAYWESRTNLDPEDQAELIAMAKSDLNQCYGDLAEKIQG